MSEPVPFHGLAGADLVIERTYLGGTAGHAGDDPIAALLPVGNQGGFRYYGSPSKATVRLVVLYTSGRNMDWPDQLDPATGTFTYYGDNRSPGHELHDTPRRGNQILRAAFAAVDRGAVGRKSVPPFLLFEKIGGGRQGRAVQFRGLMVPGSPQVRASESLVAVWRNREGQRFQNYRATFTVLKTELVSRSWLRSLVEGDAAEDAPPAWLSWLHGGPALALSAPPTYRYRSRASQLPTRPGDLALLNALWTHFQDRPIDFEPCALRLFQLSSTHVATAEVTRPSRDGGRDAIGLLALGPSADPVHLTFALEAKCYKPGNAVGVKEIARLISRLKHREFGVLITTSYVHEQAYREVREDGHPVLIICGTDLVQILKDVGLGTLTELRKWLQENYSS